jgi:hypothetical protein
MLLHSFCIVQVKRLPYSSSIFLGDSSISLGTILDQIHHFEQLVSSCSLERTANPCGAPRAQLYATKTTSPPPLNQDYPHGSADIRRALHHLVWIQFRSSTFSRCSRLSIHAQPEAIKPRHYQPHFPSSGVIHYFMPRTPLLCQAHRSQSLLDAALI